MDERQLRVELDREPAVRRREERPPTGHAHELGDEAPLAFAVTDMLEHRARMDDIEAFGWKRQVEPIGPAEGQPGIELLQKGGIVEADRRNRSARRQVDGQPQQPALTGDTVDQAAGQSPQAGQRGEGGRAGEQGSQRLRLRFSKR